MNEKTSTDDIMDQNTECHWRTTSKILPIIQVKGSFTNYEEIELQKEKHVHF